VSSVFDVLRGTIVHGGFPNRRKLKRERGPLERRFSLLLRSDDGSELELSVVGYQFPHPSDARDDWLVLNVRMKVGSESWEAEDPALVWEEARDLSKWFEGIATDDPRAGRSIDFLEPVLLFEAFRRSQDSVLLRVYCQKFPKPAQNEHFSKMFWFSREQLKKGAEQLRSELQRFPSRFPLDESDEDGDAD
jgi:hypothetical protein